VVATSPVGADWADTGGSAPTILLSDADREEEGIYRLKDSAGNQCTFIWYLIKFLQPDTGIKQ